MVILITHLHIAPLVSFQGAAKLVPEGRTELPRILVRENSSVQLQEIRGDRTMCKKKTVLQMQQLWTITKNRFTRCSRSPWLPLRDLHGK